MSRHESTSEPGRAKIGVTSAESEPAFAHRNRPAGAPNVLVILLDDTGFAQLGSFGCDVATPAMDRLAAEGLRYNRFHVTALCSPSRASLLTGRNHHAVGMGFLCDLPTGFPGYSSRLPRSAATMPRILKDAGYNTMAVGKWHLTPRDDRSASGPFDTWPLGVGFERYYGFLHGDANHWTPNLICDNHAIEPPKGPDDGYHLTEDLVDQSLRMIADQHHATPEKPFFMYFAPGAMHAPHHVPTGWADRYAGRFDDGWERSRERAFERQRATGIVPDDTVLSERPPWIADWDGLTGDERKLYARFQEVFAGFLSHTDDQIGRLIDGLRDFGVLDNTIVMLMSDNGASGEGGQIGSVNEHRFGFGVPDSLADNLAGIDDLGGFKSYNHYPWGWAWAGNTPFRLWKRYSWLGGTRAPLIVRWPGDVTDPGAIRSQFTHIVDLMPTVLDICGVDAPDEVDGVSQQAIDGVSLRSTLTDPDAAEVRSEQYFEMLGSRSMYLNGWKATTDHVSQGVADEAELEGSRDLATDRWNLFDLTSDFAETNDLAEEHPELVAELESAWWREAERNQVLPLEDGLQGRIPAMERPLWPQPRRAVLRPGFGPLADEAVPSLGGGCLVTADVTVPDDGGQGVLAAIGDWSNGWALVVIDGRLNFLLNIVSETFRIDSATRLEPGRHTLGFRFASDFAGGGQGHLYIDGIEVTSGQLEKGLGASGIQIGGGGLRLGHDTGFPVTTDYETPFPWSGTLHTVIFDSTPPSADVIRSRAVEALHRD